MGQKLEYYEDIVKGIQKYYNEYTGDANKYAVAKLLLIDHRPIIKWFDGVPYYAYIVVSDPQYKVVYKRKNTSRVDKHGKLLERRFDEGALEKFLWKYESNYHLKDWAALEGILYNQGNLIQNTVKFESQMRDLDAISLITEEFRWIKAISTQDDFASMHNIMGMNFPQSVKSGFIGEVSFARWIKLMYSDYMLNANLELMEYYVRNYKRVRVYSEYSTIVNLTEFVPCVAKFGDIDCPALESELFGWMKSNFKAWMTDMLWYPRIPSVNGSVSVTEKTDEKLACYTNRAAVEIITKISAGVTIGRNMREVYSPKYLMGSIYAAIWGPTASGLNPPQIFYSNQVKWNRLVREDTIMGFYTGEKEVPEGYTVSEVEYTDMLFMEMLASVYGFNKASVIDRFRPVKRLVGIDDVRKAGILSND